MLLTMEEIKAQLRLDEDFDADDRHLQLLACAAQKRTETYLNRKLYAPDENHSGQRSGRAAPAG